MENFDSKQILSGIIKNDTNILQYIYRRYYSVVNRFIEKNGGTYDDSNDIFQDAVLFIYRKLKAENLKLEDCSFETYFLSVCRFIWLKRQYETEKIKIENIDNKFNDELFDFDNDYSLKLRYQVYQNNFEKLSKDDKRLLELYYDKTSKKNIISIMGFSSIEEYDKALIRAKEQIQKLIKKDPAYKKIRRTIDNYVDKQDE